LTGLVQISTLDKIDEANSSAALISISLERRAKEPLQSQLVRQLRHLILERRIKAGEKLPSSRLLSEELSVSRVTITGAMDQLISEGYAEGRRGSGVYVAEELPDYMPRIAHRAAGPALDLRHHSTEPRPFEIAAPDHASFPYREWARLHDRVWRSPEPALLAKPDPFGWGPLRSAISEHLHDWRGISCDPAQIVITSGVVDAIDLIAAIVFDEGDTVVVEEPGYDTIRRALTRNKLQCEVSRVDLQGFDVNKAVRAHPQAQGVVVTPSRQYPLGMTLPLARRLELLRWAMKAEGYVIEDDYDSEYRYQGQPLPALMSLDDYERVIYVGSFSKVLSSTLRLGFAVLPVPLIRAAKATLAEVGPRVSLVSQPALARFMEDGSFAKHIRRTRRLYVKRQRALVSAIKTHMDDLLDVEFSPAGMHLVANFRTGVASRMTDDEASARAAANGVTAKPLSSFYFGRCRAQGLALGYAGFDERRLDAGVAALKRALS
jgi:GntR family transcriptional regulator/MocR family aminotransferase